jgi:hypothetical protein
VPNATPGAVWHVNASSSYSIVALRGEFRDGFFASERSHALPLPNPTGGANLARARATTDPGARVDSPETTEREDAGVKGAPG